MRFDLFDAMAILKKELGNNARIILSFTDTADIIVEIVYVFNYRTIFKNSFKITFECINDCNVAIMNNKFNNLVHEIKNKLKELENGSQTY